MAFTEALCPKMQQSLINVARENAGVLTRSQTGFLDAIISDRNKQGYEQINVGTPNGGTKVIEVVYIQPSTTADTQTTKPTLCVDTPIESAPQADVIDPSTLTGRYTKTFILSDEEVAKICYQTSDEYRAELIMSKMNSLAESINADILAQALNLFGNPYQTGAGPTYTYVPPVAPIVAPIIRAADNTALLQNYINSVERRMKEIRVTNRPFVVGAGNPGIDLFAQLLSIGCCNDAGINISAGAGRMNYFYDQMADLVWGANEFAVFAPGAFQLITHNDYADYTDGQGNTYTNPKRKFTPNVVEQDTIVDPFTGLVYDFKMYSDNCGESYKFFLGVNFKLWALSADMYKDTDRMFGTRSSLLFQATAV